MDNLRTHHIQAVGELLHGAGADVLYLPPYSPDLNPIEKLWSKVKAILRKLRVRSLNALDAAIALPLTVLLLTIALAGSVALVIVYFEYCSNAAFLLGNATYVDMAFVLELIPRVEAEELLLRIQVYRRM